MAYNNTYSTGIGSYSNTQSSGSMSGTGNFLNWLRSDRKNSGNWKKDFKGVGESETSGDAGFLRSTLGSFGSKPLKKQLFQSAAYQGERRRDFNLRHTTGNLGDILRNLNFDKQPKQKQQELPISNKYSGQNTKISTKTTFSLNSPSHNPPVTSDFRKQRYMQSTVYQSHANTNYEPYLPPTQQKKQSSASFVSGGKKFDIDEMFNKIKREKQLESELKRLREEKRMRQEGWKEKDGDKERETQRERQRQKGREKERQRERQKQKQRQSQKAKQIQRQKISANTSSSLSTFIGSQKFSSAFSSFSSRHPPFYPKHSPQQYSSYSNTNTSYTARNADNSSNDYDKKYGGFVKKQKYGAYTPKREYEFQKKTYEFEKKYDTAGKKDYDWKNIKTTPYQGQSGRSYTSRPIEKGKNPQSSQSTKDDRLAKYFMSSSSHKVQKFDCKVTIRDFRLGKQLGEGKFGTVYQAIHKSTNSLYALKKVPKSIIKSHYMIDQFILQIKLQSFMSNEYILALHGFFHDLENIYLILDYMQQGTLYTILKKNKRLEYGDAATKIKQIAKGIIYMHENGIAHRDIKPENVVISNGSCKLCDFGWSTICDQRRKTYCGTFDYAAPEILQGAEYDMSVDLWCLGVMAYQLLVGKAPFYHIKKQETKKRILNVQSQPIVFPSDIPYEAVDFIQRLLKKNPEQRIKNQQLLYHPFLINA